MPAHRWVMWSFMMLACFSYVGLSTTALAQSYVNPQLNGDYNCDFSERVVSATNYDVRQQTWYPESTLNHRMNPGSGSLVQDIIAQCTGLNLGSFGFTLPSIEAILAALVAALIQAACSAARQAVARITSLFPSIPCYNGCNFGGSIPLAAPGSPMSAGGSASAPDPTSGQSQSTPDQQWSTVRSLFEAPQAPAAQPAAAAPAANGATTGTPGGAAQ